MNDDLEIPKELILAGVGVLIALVLLVILSALQKLRKRGAAEDRVRQLNLPRGGPADSPAGMTPYFVACFRGNSARFFRVYSVPGELLLLYAGLPSRWPCGKSRAARFGLSFMSPWTSVMLTNGRARN